MSISHSLSNALSGLTAASRLAEVVSSNVSNSLTEGYARRTLNLSASSVGGLGAGVQITGVTRHVDQAVLSSRRLADASLGGASFLAESISSVQNLVGSVGEEGSLSARVVAVETALVDASADPASEIGLTVLSQRFDELAGSLNAASDGIQAQRAVADASIADQVDALNAALGQVENLNKDIVTARSSGFDSAGLMDTRQQIIDSISEIVPIRQFNRDNGQVALMTTSGEALIDGAAKTFEFSPNAIITPDMTIASGGLSGITVDGVSIAANGFGRLSGGSLAAAFKARDNDLVDAQGNLDNLAADLITRFQDTGLDPTLAPGDAGILTDAGASYDGSSIVGLSARISLNNQIDPEQGGMVTNLRDGVYATSVGSAGDSSLLQSMSSALTEPRSIGTDLSLSSAAGRAAKLEADIGSQRLSYDADLSFEATRWASFKEAEAADGVDTDYELQTLLRVEQAYAANARVIQTVDTLMQRLMEI